MSKLFGKVKNRPTKEQFAEELLDSEMSNLGRAVTGEDKGEGEIKERERHLAKMIKDYKEKCYTDAQLAKVKLEMQRSGDTKHTLFDIPGSMERAWSRKRATLFFVNLPMMIGIPAFMEFVDIQAKYGERADLVMGIFTAIDVIFCVKTYLLYHFLQKLVSEIEYDSVEDKVTITQPHGSTFLGKVKLEYKPKELEKKLMTPGKTSFNRSLRYRSIKKGENMREFGTEIPGAEWHDRKFLDTIISQPGERFKNHKKMKRWQDKKKGNNLE